VDRLLWLREDPPELSLSARSAAHSSGQPRETYKSFTLAGLNRPRLLFFEEGCEGARRVGRDMREFGVIILAAQQLGRTGLEGHLGPARLHVRFCGFLDRLRGRIVVGRAEIRNFSLPFHPVPAS
jgi:hypothetical protein